MSYCTSFSWKGVKRVKGYDISGFWWKIEFWDFQTILDKNLDLHFVVRFLHFFWSGQKLLYISTISSINICEIGWIAKTLCEVKILTSKNQKKRQILYINRSRKTFVHDILRQLTVFVLIYFFKTKCVCS